MPAIGSGPRKESKTWQQIHRNEPPPLFTHPASNLGYETGYYHLLDYPDKVERLFRTMEELEREQVWPLIAESPAKPGTVERWSRSSSRS